MAHILQVLFGLILSDPQARTLPCKHLALYLHVVELSAWETIVQTCWCLHLALP